MSRSLLLTLALLSMVVLPMLTPALVSASLLMMAQTFAYAQLRARTAARREAFDAFWRPRLVAASLDEEPEPLPAPQNELERIWLLLLWNRLQRHLRGSAHARLNQSLRELHMQRHALHQLQRGTLAEQLSALECLRHLADPGYWKDVEPLVHDRSAAKSLAAAETLVALDAARALKLLLPLALHRHDWAHARLSILCQHAGKGATTPPLLEMLQGFSATSPAARQRVLSMVPCGEAAQLADWARRALDEDSADLPERLAAIGTLAILRDPADHARITTALAHPDAGIRLAAAWALGQQARKEDTPALLSLLGDRDWAVRQAAADVIAGLPWLDASALATLPHQVQDRYGSEALVRAISERSP